MWLGAPSGLFADGLINSELICNSGINLESQVIERLYLCEAKEEEEEEEEEVVVLVWVDLWCLFALPFYRFFFFFNMFVVIFGV